MLIRYEPFRDFSSLTEQRLSENRTSQIPMDAYRRGDEFKVMLDLPGTDPGSIELTVEKEVLTVQATRTWHKGADDQVQIAERGHGHFTRQLFLGEGLDRESLKASYEDGVLTVTIPVLEEAKPRKVEVIHLGGVVHELEAALSASSS
jgi:HSP20 family protein